MSAVADGVGRAVCGVRAHGRVARRGGRAAHTQHRRWDCGNCIGGEEVAATFGGTEDLFPEGSLFVSLRATGHLLTRAACLLSVRLKKMSERRYDRKT